MSTSPSYERINYLLRTNKNIERKLVFDLLRDAAVRVGFSAHWYLGFGSMWFVDFRLAERLLGIHTMISLEVGHAERAEYNRPFRSVQVKPGLSGTTMASFSEEQWQTPLIAWLDYDGPLVDDVIADVDLLLGKAAPNSVVLFTLNAERKTYRTKRPDGILEREETAVGRVEGMLGVGAIGARYQPTANPAGAWTDVPEQDFPQCFAEALLTFMQHRTFSMARTYDGKPLHFYPLFCLHHNDGANMVTVGGALAPELDASPWPDALRAQPILADVHGEVQYTRLDLVPLTVKEKITLDACLPEGEAAFLTKAKDLGLKVSDDQMMKYRRFYRHFPVFLETPL